MDRKERVRKQKIRQRDDLIKKSKEKRIKDRLEHKSRNKGIPIVNGLKERFEYLNYARETEEVEEGDSILMRNYKVLDRMFAEHEALLEFRKENNKSQEIFENAQKNQEEIVGQIEDV